MGKKQKKHEKFAIAVKILGVQKENNNISTMNTLVSSRHITKTSKSKTDKRKKGCQTYGSAPLSI